jgi:CelD/BcsL family acetyltransferase involved in cellulose biosynthesis
MLSVSGLIVEAAHDFEPALDGKGTSQAFVTREEWDALLRASACDVVFMTWQWQSLWWRHFGAQGDCTLHLLAIHADGGALVGIAPLFVASEPLPPPKEYAPGEDRPKGEGPPVRVVRIVGGTEVADYLDVIAPPDYLEQVWAAVLDYLVEHRGEWDVIDLHSLPQFSPSREIVERLARERDLSVRVFPEDVAPVLELPGDWNTYLMSLRKKDRHELRRKVRKLESRDDVRWHLVPSTDRQEIVRSTRIFLDVHRKSDPEKAEFMDERMAAFFLDMASSLAHTGWLDLSILRIGEQPASAYFSFNYNGRLYLYNSGFDPRFASYSTGMALLAYRIHKAIKQGLRYFDFLRGSEPYKYHFGAKNTYVYRAMMPIGEGA